LSSFERDRGCAVTGPRPRGVHSPSRRRGAPAARRDEREREAGPATHGDKVSDRLERWFNADQPKTLGSLIDLFGEKSFAVVFIVLMALPALPLPTGGVTHLFELIAMLLALELVVGRRTIWLPRRWKGLELSERSGQRFASLLLRRIRWFEQFSRPRLRSVLHHRLSGALFGTVVFALALTAFIAPPFSGLDTLPALGVVVLALGILLEDFILAAVGFLVGLLGAVLVVGLGGLAVRWLQQFL
jgi:hypothetical protein